MKLLMIKKRFDLNNLSEKGGHLNAPYHFDYFYANEELINKLELMYYYKFDSKDELPNKFEILDSSQWICLSDHLPLVLKFE